MWARKNGAHCGSQLTPPTEECNPELLGCCCSKACPMTPPFQHCHTLRVSLGVGLGQAGAQQELAGRSAVIVCSMQRKGKMQRSVPRCNGTQGQTCRKVKTRGDGAAMCVSPAQQAKRSP